MSSRELLTRFALTIIGALRFKLANKTQREAFLEASRCVLLGTLYH